VENELVRKLNPEKANSLPEIRKDERMVEPERESIWRQPEKVATPPESLQGLKGESGGGSEGRSSNIPKVPGSLKACESTVSCALRVRNAMSEKPEGE
jgi:hypothetical protein